MSTPKYREEAKGQIRQFTADFKATLLGEMGADDAGFYFGTDMEIRESEAYREYSAWLTDSEMLKAAKSCSP